MIARSVLALAISAALAAQSSSPARPTQGAGVAPPAASNGMSLEWMQRVRFVEPAFVRGLLVRDFRSLTASRNRALAYVSGLVTQFNGACPVLFPLTLSEAALAPIAGALKGQTGRGDVNALLGVSASVKGADAAAIADAQAIGDGLFFASDSTDPRDPCSSATIKALSAGIRAFVENPDGPSPTASPRGRK